MRSHPLHPWVALSSRSLFLHSVLVSVVGKVYLLGLQKVCTCFSLFCPSWLWLAFREEQEFEENPTALPKSSLPIL